MNRLAWLVLVAGAGLGLLGCGERHGKGSKPPPEVERAPRLETIKPQLLATFTVTRDYAATVEPLERAEIYPQVRGVVRYVSPDADIGRHITGEKIPPRVIASVLAQLGTEPLLGVATILGEQSPGEVLIRIAVPDVLAERDNKRALLELSKEAREQAARAREVAAREVKEAEAQRKRARADVAYRNSLYQRMLRLVSTDTVQKQQAEEAELQYRSALAGFEAAEAQLLTKQARQYAAEGEERVAEAKVRVARADLDRLEAMVGFATIRAPFDGIVTRRWIDRGQTVKDFGNPLLQVMRTDVMRVLIDVPERDAPYVRAARPGRAGNPVTLTVPALQGVGKGKFTGHITLTAGSLDPVTRTMRAEIWMANPGGYLLPQMTGTASVVLEERHNVYVVPSSCLVRNGDKAAVYCIAEAKEDRRAGVVRRLRVEVGVDNGAQAEIRRGLKGNEQIIAKGNGVVRAGDFAIAVPAE
jgi:RND family efflux transporter MFP subunit